MRRLRTLFVAVALLTACGESVTGLPFFGPPLPRAATGLTNVTVRAPSGVEQSALVIIAR